MFKNHIKKLVIIAICAILALPMFSFSKNINIAKADTYDLTDTVFISVAYDIDIEKEGIKDVTMDNIKITVKDIEQDTTLVIFEDNKRKHNPDDKWCEYVSFSKNDNFRITIILRKVGNYEIVVSNVDNESVNYTAYLTVTDDVSKINVEYDNTLLSGYKDLIDKELEDKKINSSFTLPSLKNYIITSVNYDRITKKTYYAAPGAVEYSMVEGTKSSPSFNLSKFGTYRFYTEFYIEKFAYDGEPISLTTQYLIENENGFYKLTDPNNANAQVYYSNKKYYLDKELTTEFAGEIASLTQTLVIPIFKFNIEYSAPSVEITSTYEDEGFIGLEKNITSVKVNGTDIETIYTLQYVAKEEDATEESTLWETAEEEFDTAEMSFTPTKKGVYRLQVYAVDGLGNKSNVAYTKNIVVTQKHFIAPYKTSFSEWLSVNTFPFILLCISATCLLAIIALLVIKPKDKNVDKVEEDR